MTVSPVAPFFFFPPNVTGNMDDDRNNINTKSRMRKSTEAQFAMWRVYVLCSLSLSLSLCGLSDWLKRSLCGQSGQQKAHEKHESNYTGREKVTCTTHATQMCECEERKAKLPNTRVNFIIMLPFIPCPFSPSFYLFH